MRTSSSDVRHARREYVHAEAGRPAGADAGRSASGVRDRRPHVRRDQRVDSDSHGRGQTMRACAQLSTRQSLPAVPSLEAYLSSHQAAIGQLAIEYCHALIENPTLRTATFPGFNFTTTRQRRSPTRTFCSIPLLNRMLGLVQLGHQPDKNAARTELSRLVEWLPRRPGALGWCAPAC